MAESQPIAEQLSSPSRPPLTGLAWDDVRNLLADSDNCLLATCGADARVHTVPVLGVWLDGALCFSSDQRTRKTHQLAENPHCSVTVAGDDIDIALEGTAYLVRENTMLQRISDLFPIKYPWWHPLVHDGEFHDPADTSLGNPRHVFAVTPKVVFAFGKQHGCTATRWRF